MRICPSYRHLPFLFLALALPLIARAQETYTNPVFQVTLQYPSGWHHVEGYEEKYGGADGFFQLSAMDGRGWTIEGACELQASHHLRPYGSSPQLERWQVQGQEACLIWPSEDQTQDMRGQAALIVRYPQPVQIRGSVYYYFILEADKNHVQEIIQTLHFAVPSESTYTGPDLRHPKRWTLGVRRAEESGPQETYTSPVFQVTLQYPAGWQQMDGYEERYGGDGGADGFFQLSALSGEGKTIEEVCEWEAANFTYGFLPQIQWWQVQGQDACVIWPSEDQELVKRGQAALISRYPKPVQIRGAVYHHLVLWADKYHIEGMAKTLHFVGPSAGTSNGPDLRHPKRLILKLRGIEAATKPVFNPETHALKYMDRQLCFAVDVPAEWTSDGIPGAFAWFGFREQEQLSFNISTDNLVAPILEQALASVRRGSLGPYIQEVRDFTLSNQSALWVTFTPAPVADAFRFVVLVIAPDCGDRPHSLFIGAKPGAEREQFETFLSHLRFLRSGS